MFVPCYREHNGLRVNVDLVVLLNRFIYWIEWIVNKSHCVSSGPINEASESAPWRQHLLCGESLKGHTTENQNYTISKHCEPACQSPLRMWKLSQCFCDVTELIYIYPTFCRQPRPLTLQFLPVLVRVLFRLSSLTCSSLKGAVRETGCSGLWD